jgi:ketosteroid isomerase-like protein
MWAGLAAAMVAADTGRVARFYLDSAVMAETGSPTARGRSAIVAATAAVFQCCVYRESRPTIERTDLAGPRAIQFGTYRDVLEPKGQPPLALYGRFDAVVERDSSSSWKVRRLVVIRDSMIELPTGRQR